MRPKVLKFNLSGYCFGFFLFLFLRQSLAATVRKPPAFSKPIYSDSYLPAAMQVIFYTVEQLKLLHAEDALLSATSTLPSTAASKPVDVTTEKTTETPSDNAGTPVVGMSTVPAITEGHQENPAMNSEASETPEMNYETPEMIHATQETNHETPEIQQISTEISADKLSTVISFELKNDSSSFSSTSPSKIVESETPNSQDVDEDSKEDGKEVLDEAEEENRFTLLGEKVTQVPRPSLTNYLRKANIPLRPSLKQLAGLYDSLSKDARKQGFSKYSGYSDEVLAVLQESSGGGVGPQLKILLARIVERNELTRDDAKTNTDNVIRELDEPGSALNTDLRRLLPLHFAA